MNQADIQERLEAHDKVPTKEAAVNFKKSLGTKVPLCAQREKAMQFFHNPNITSDLRRVDDALKNIVEEEKSVKMNLKRVIAKEEYNRMGEEPSIEAKKQKLMVPPKVFETEEHLYESDEDFNNFTCNKCDFTSNSEQIMIKHMEKKRRDDWTQMLENMLKYDRRLREWYESPSNFKHLSLKHNLPNPDIEKENDEQPVVDVDKPYKAQEFTTPGTSKAEKVPLRMIREMNKDKEKVRRLSGELEVEKTKRKEDYVKCVERGVRAGIKRRKLDDSESENEDVKVVEKSGNILKVKTTKVIEERNTGRIRNICSTAVLHYWSAAVPQYK